MCILFLTYAHTRKKGVKELKFKVSGNLPTLIIEAKNKEEAIEKYIEETEYNDFKVTEIKN